LVEPRSTWATVILIAALGFINYLLWKLYGTRSPEITGFLGGLVNSTALRPWLNSPPASEKWDRRSSTLRIAELCWLPPRWSFATRFCSVDSRISA
jgi:hypothetical protein